METITFVLFAITILINAMWIFCAIHMKSIAKKHQLNQALWFVIGLILGPLAFIFISSIREKKITI